MMKQFKTIFLIITIVFVSIGCNQKGSVEENVPKDVNKTEETQTTDENEKEETDQSIENEKEADQSSKKVMIYSMNTNVDGFISEEVELPEITADSLLEQLILKSVITPEVKILSCKESTLDGIKVLDLDFSSTLDVFMNNVGSSAEYYVIGSICNTFLEAYDAEQIKITIEGGSFETGHAQYPGYMSKFTQ
jgi:predicted small lipoprotein YifL